jgi:hypothetical protein
MFYMARIRFTKMWMGFFVLGIGMTVEGVREGQYLGALLGFLLVCVFVWRVLSQ